MITKGCDISCEIALRWMTMDLIDEKSTLVLGNAVKKIHAFSWPQLIQTAIEVRASISNYILYNTMNKINYAYPDLKRTFQDYMYVKLECWINMYKKHYLRLENKVNENKALSYCDVLRCETKTTKSLFYFMSN